MQRGTQEAHFWLQYEILTGGYGDAMGRRRVPADDVLLDVAEGISHELVTAARENYSPKFWAYANAGDGVVEPALKFLTALSAKLRYLIHKGAFLLHRQHEAARILASDIDCHIDRNYGLGAIDATPVEEFDVAESVLAPQASRDAMVLASAAIGASVTEPVDARVTELTAAAPPLVGHQAAKRAETGADAGTADAEMDRSTVAAVATIVSPPALPPRAEHKVAAEAEGCGMS